MAKLSSFKRLITEDFREEDRELVTKVAASINDFADEVISSMNNRLSIDDNLNIVKKDLNVTVDGSGNVIGSVKLKTDLDHTCQGLLVIRATNLITPGNTPSGTPFITFTESSGLLTISKITNLTASEQYRLKIIIF